MGDFPTWQQLGLLPPNNDSRPALHERIEKVIEHLKQDEDLWEHGSLKEGCNDI